MDRRAFLIAAGAVAAGARASALGAGAPHLGAVALVTADTESQVVAVDARTGEIVTRIPTPAGPRSIEMVGAVAVVAHSDLGQLTLIDGPSLRARELVGRLDEPRYVAAHPDRRHAYVSDSALEAVVVIDVVRGRAVRRVAVGGPARHIGIDGSGRRLWTALGSTAAEIAVLDLSDPLHPRLTHRVRPPFLAHDVAFAPDGRAWVSSGHRRALAIYEPGARRPLGRIAADAPPQHVAFGPRVAYVTSGDDGTLRVHRLDGRLLRVSAIPIGSFNVSRGAGHVAAPSLAAGTLALLNRHGQVVRTVRIAPAAHDACLLRRAT